MFKEPDTQLADLERFSSINFPLSDCDISTPLVLPTPLLPSFRRESDADTEMIMNLVMSLTLWSRRTKKELHSVLLQLKNVSECGGDQLSQLIRERVFIDCIDVLCKEKKKYALALMVAGDNALLHEVEVMNCFVSQTVVRFLGSPGHQAFLVMDAKVVVPALDILYNILSHAHLNITVSTHFNPIVPALNEQQQQQMALQQAHHYAAMAGMPSMRGIMRRRYSNHRSRGRLSGCLQDVVDAGYLNAIEPLIQLCSPFRGKVLESLQWICGAGPQNVEQVLRCGPLLQSIVKAAQNDWEVHIKRKACVVLLVAAEKAPEASWRSITHRGLSLKQLSDASAIEALCAMLNPNQEMSDTLLLRIVGVFEKFLRCGFEARLTYAKKIEKSKGLEFLVARKADAEVDGKVDIVSRIHRFIGLLQADCLMAS